MSERQHLSGLNIFPAILNNRSMMLLVWKGNDCAFLLRWEKLVLFLSEMPIEINVFTLTYSKANW